MMVAARLVVCAVLASLASARVHLKPWQRGDVVEVQCRDEVTKRWGPGPKCTESGERLKFKFGVDSFLYCGFKIEDEAMYNRTRKYITLEQAWHCRVPMSSDKSFHIPFPLSVWGVVEESHFHMDNHMNFVFHVELAKDGTSGKIMGAAAYPVRDRFQSGKVGSTINCADATSALASRTAATFSRLAA